MFFWQQKRGIEWWISPVNRGGLIRKYDKFYFRVLTDAYETIKIFVSL